MARLFVSANETWLEAANTPSITSVVSAAARHRFANTPTVSALFLAVGDSGGGNLNYDITWHGTYGGYAFEYSTAPNTFVTMHSTDAGDNGTWHTFVATSDFSIAGTKLYKDATSQGFTTTGTTGVPYSGANERALIGAFPQAGGLAAAYMNGDLAEVAVWNAVLTQAEVTSYQKGYSPSQIRPGNLVHYWPIMGRTSPEIELVGGFSATLHSTPANSAHPRIIMPKVTQNRFIPADTVSA